MPPEDEQPRHPKPKKPRSLPKRAKAPEPVEELSSDELVEDKSEGGGLEIETTAQSAERMHAERAGSDMEALTAQIKKLEKQKETNAASTGLNEAMANKINAEIDKNIAELSSKRDALEGVYSSAPPTESLPKSGPREKAPLPPRAEGEAPRTYAEHRDDIDKVLGRIESAAEPKEVEVDLSDLNAEVEKAQKEAEEKTEAEFFARGETISKGHEMGLEQSRRNEAERRGDVGAERQAMAERAETLRRQMPAMEQQMARAEKLLRDQGIKDVDEAMAKRATGGLLDKAKGFFGKLFSKKSREMDHAMDLYADIRDQYTEKQAELAELDNRAKNPEQFRQAMQLKGERKSPPGR